MAEDVLEGLFDDEVSLGAESRGAFAQDGPDLFGTEPDELILPSEPVPVNDPEMEIDLDEMSEVPVDPDDEPDADAIEAGEGPGGGSVEDETDEQPGEDTSSGAALLPPAAPRRAPRQERPDAPLALYRRYRPDTFAEVIGQEHVTDPLQRALTNNKVSHAYLFSGPRGCGKTTSARILARCLNCEQGPTPNPCGVCQSCRDLARGGGGSIDVIEIDAASHGGVDEARDLRERAFFAPVHSRYKIYIIDEAHMVTNAGFNALLKVVEEPPVHVKFIFATTEPEKVIGTIRSRTHHYPFRLVPPRTLTSYLAQLCEAEGVSVEPSVLPLVVRAGAGSVRDSLSVLDQLLGGAADAGVSYRQATRLLGYTPDSLLDEVMDAFAAGDAQGVFACIDKVVEVGQDPRRFGEDLLRRLRDLIIVAAVPDALTSGLVDVAADQAERLTTQASTMGPGELTRAAEVIAKGLTDMRGTTAPRLHLELMCARVLLPGADVDDRGIHARLDRIERRLHMASDADPVPAAPPVGPDFAGPDSPRADAPRSDGPRPEARHLDDPRPDEPPSRRPRREEPSRQTDAPARETSRPTAQRPRVSQPAPDPEHPPVPEAPPVADPWAQPWPDTPAPQPARRSEPEPPAPQAARAPEPERRTPAPEREAVRERPRPPAPTPAEQTAPPASDPGMLSTAQLRAEWPNVLERVKGRRRVTWIVVRENAVVHDYAADVLTLAFSNPGARESFTRGGHDAILREVLREAFGVAATVRAVDGGDAPVPDPAPPYGAAPAPRSVLSPDAPGPREPDALAEPRDTPPDAGWRTDPAPETGRRDREGAPRAENPRPPAAGPEASDHAVRAIAQARANVQRTQVGVGEDDEAGESLDDVDLDQGAMNVDELLIKRLGAELIAEEPPEQ